MAQLLILNKVNPSAQIRYEDWNGRKYLVAPLVLMVEGVLNGSMGPIYYPGDEIKSHPKIWNGMPLVVYHPKQGNSFVSARDPKKLQEVEIGRNFYTKSSKSDKLQRLVSEGWFDIEAANRVDPSIIANIEKGIPLELSVGLDGELTAAVDGAKDSQGKVYNYTVHNFKPDHIAILPTGKGACSIADGCGVLVNSSGVGEQDTYFIVNPKGKWQPPQSGDAPAGVKRILKAVYSKYRDAHPAENAETKATGAKIAWAAVKKAGWVKNKAGKWVKRKKKMVTNASPSLWERFKQLFITNQPSHNDIRHQLQMQLEERYKPKAPTAAEMVAGMEPMEIECPWVSDVYDKYVVYCIEDEIYKLGYTTDLRTNKVTLSDEEPVEVQRVVQYKVISNEQVDTTQPSKDPVQIDVVVDPNLGKFEQSVVNSSQDELVTKTSTVVNNDNTTFLQENKPMALSETDRKQFIVNLKGDCKCGASMPWKGMDETALTALSDDTLSAYEMVRKSQETITNSVPVVTPTPAPVVTAPVVTPPVVTPAQVPVAQPIVNRLTAEEQEDLAFARSERMRRRQAMVDRLTASITDANAKTQAAAIYNTMNPEHLVALCNALPEPVQQVVSTGGGWQDRWALAAGAPIVNQAAITEEPLLSPTWTK